MSSFNYVDSPNPNLCCCICRSPFVDPCTTRTCCHTFCYDCIAQAIEVSQQCPIDRTPLSLHDLAPADPVVRNLVDELVVICPQEPRGCQHSCQRLLLPVHLKDTCKHVETVCPKPKCGKRLLKKDVGDHVCSSQEPTESQHEGEDVTDLDSGRQAPNPESSTKTGQSTGPSADLLAENAMLRLRLSALENVVHSLRSEMFAVKHALGPWYRHDIQQQPVMEEPSADDFRASSQAFEYQLAEDLSAQASAHAPETNAAPPARDPSDIASYFPPAEDYPPEGSRRHRSTSSTSGLQPQTSSAPQTTGPTSPAVSYSPMYATNHPAAGFSSSTFSHPAPPPNSSYQQGPQYPGNSFAISIPPLDPATTLPDTLASLHSSLGTIAGALGALAAARGAESLRTNEELRGIRAAMHGLRMQVHDILTNRAHITEAQGLNSALGDEDGREMAFGMGPSPWMTYGPRMPAMYSRPPGPPFGIAHPPPPSNITKL